MVRLLGFMLFVLQVFMPVTAHAAFKYSPERKEYLEAKKYCRQFKSQYDKMKACTDRYDLDRCGTLSNITQRNNCLYTVAVGRKDYVICQNLSSVPEMARCYNEVARITQDPSICYRIPIDYARQSVDAGRQDPKWACYRMIRQLNPRYNARLRNLDSLFELDDKSQQEDRLCTSTLSPTMDILALKEQKIQRCGNFYRVPTDNPDIPEILVDYDGRKIGSCRKAIDGPDGLSQWGRDQRCDLICEDPDVCRGHLLDCAQLALPSDIPEDYIPQMKYYRKRLIYEYLKTSPTKMTDMCVQINQSRQEP